MAAVTIPAESNQYVWGYVRQDHPITGGVDLSGYTVQMAITVNDPVEADWKAAAWEASPKVINGVTWYLARLEIGPNGGDVTLTEDATYQVHVRITTGAERPVIYCGAIHAS